jgi:exopolysaccharide production protein ExoQ
MQDTSTRHSLLQSVTLEDCACTAILAFFAVQGAIPFIAPNQALEVRNAAASGFTYWGGILSQAVVYGAICSFVCADLGRVVRWLGAMRWTAAIACFAIASSLWSQFPSYTLRRSLPFALAGLFGLWFALRFPIRRQLSILWISMVALALGSIVLALSFPHIGLDVSPGHYGDWQGAFTSKNGCGRIMVLATAVALSLEKGATRRIVSLLQFLFVMIMSGSRGAWVIEAVVLGIYAASKIAGRADQRSRVIVLVFGSAIAIAVAVAAIANYAALVALIGRDATLTGRTEIWKQVWPFIAKRPMLGWGYSGFWRGIQGESFKVVAAMRFILFHAHNGFLEIWLELGAFGLALFAASYLRAWRKLWPRLRSG